MLNEGFFFRAGLAGDAVPAGVVVVLAAVAGAGAAAAAATCSPLSVSVSFGRFRGVTVASAMAPDSVAVGCRLLVWWLGGGVDGGDWWTT